MNRYFSLAFIFISGSVYAGQITDTLPLLGSISFSSGPVSIQMTTHTAAGSSNTNTITTPAIDTKTPGSTFEIAAVAWYTGSVIGSFTDSNNNSWIQLNQYTNSSATGITFYYAASPVTSTAQTFTVNGSGFYPAVAVAAFKSTPGVPFDVQNGAANSSATTLQPGSITPSIDNELLVTALAIGAAGTGSISSGFTITDQIAQNGASNYGIALGYLFNGAGTGGVAINPTWTDSGSATALATNIAAFK